MNTFSRIGRSAAAVALAGALVAPAIAQDAPAATLHIHGGSAAFIVGGSWGDGRLEYRGREVPVSVGGLSVGAIGVNSYDIVGQVYHLNRLSDIEGTFAAVNASATVGPGAGVIEMRNGNGVVIDAQSTSAGLALSLAPTGMQIKLKS